MRRSSSGPESQDGPASATAGGVGPGGAAGDGAQATAVARGLVGPGPQTALLGLRAVVIACLLHPAAKGLLGLHAAMDCEAHAGALGLLQDLLRVAWGSGMAPLLLAAVALPLPLYLHLPLHAFVCAVLARGAPALCTTRLLAGPLSASRIANFHALLSAMSQPLGTWAMAMAALLDAGDAARGCRTFVGACHLAGLLLSTVTTAHLRSRSPAAGFGWLGAASARAELSIRRLSSGNIFETEEGHGGAPAAPAAGGGWRVRLASWWLVACAVWGLAITVMAAKAAASAL